ncbi:MAG: hypothetical protein CMC81_05385 [Flavobacteriaceae bacterium]|nr:hypothetical protein [Flavobacteriaceae bacterium]|tara:strand:+ start:4846 stop:5256 length:411 start_codon:yes stop_codon:yes gene_type:complete
MLNKYLNKSIVFYDGHCPMCHYWVRYAIKKDIDNKLFFSPIQGDFGQKFIIENELTSYDSVIFHLPNRKPFIYSSAVLELLRFLKLKNLLFYLLIFSPTILSDFFYKLIAKIRYSVFNKYDECRIPDKEMTSRIIF